MTIKLVYFQLTFQGDDGNITHSESGMALCDGNPDGESFKRNIASRYYRTGDAKVLFTFEVVKQAKTEK